MEDLGVRGLRDQGLIKICGLSRPADIDAATAAGADLIGLVFVEGSARYLTPAAARPLVRRPRGGEAVVGLFQNPALSEIEEVLDAVPLDMIQLHGDENHDAVARIGASFGLPIIKAIGVHGVGDLYEAAGCPADLMLYDAKAPAGAKAAGGHGTAFDWSVLGKVQHRTPWLLAGGLSPENVASAITACRGLPGFSGVDVSSGVEASRGVKDASAIARFAKAARAAMATPTGDE